MDLSTKYAGAMILQDVNLSPTELQRVADVLSSIAADIRKGEDKRGTFIEIRVARDE